MLGAAGFAAADAWFSARAELPVVARGIDDHVTEVRTEALAMVSELGQGEGCDQAALRALLTKAHFVRNIGKIHGNRLYCDALDGDQASIELGPPKVARHNDGVRFWIFPNQLWAAQGNDAVVMHPASFLDAVLTDRTAAAIVEGESGRVLVSSEPMPDALISAAWRRGGETFVLDGYLVASVRSRNRLWLGVVARPLSAVQAQAMAALPRFLLAGVLFGLALATAVVVALGRRRSLQSELRRALKHERLQIVLQPIVRFDNGVPYVQGFESLARWTLTNGEEIPAAFFVPLIEREGLGADLARCMVARLVREFGDALRAYPDTYVALNLSSADVADSRLLDDIDRMLAAGLIKPQQVVIELTERIFETAGLAEGLERLRRAGHQLSIDDFGTGGSNASQLATFSPEMVKIDRYFVAHADSDSPAATLLPQLVAMARSCGARVVIEGVETAEQAHRLTGLGEVLAQGYFWHPPMEPWQARALLTSEYVAATRQLIKEPQKNYVHPEA